MAEKIFSFQDNVAVTVGKFLDKDLPLFFAWVYIKDPVINFEMVVHSFSSEEARGDFLEKFSVEEAERAVNIARDRVLAEAKRKVKRIKRFLRTQPPLTLTEEEPDIPIGVLEF